MKKSLFQRLQQVSLRDIGHIFLYLLALLPSLIYKLTHDAFWLICDYGAEARDNGYYFYKYMIENQPDERCIYAIDYRSPDYERVRDLGETVRFGSLKHWILYLAAEVNISSQKGGKPNAAVCYLLEVVLGILKNKRVFLQHGIIKDDLPFVHYDQAKFTMFVTSVKREQDYIAENFGYPDGIVTQTGLARFDDLYDTSDGGTILVMPTWRQWINNSDSETQGIEDISDFTKTQYYKCWNEFLNSEELLKLLDVYDKKLVFYPHRNMQEYADDFAGEGERITIAKFPEYDVHELLKASALLITDYSSVAMDFAYLDKPVIYYQFDYDRFRENHMSEGYFSYEADGFGPIAPDANKLLSEVELSLATDFALQPMYKARIDDFFDLRDHNNCERTYEAILERIK